MTAACARAGLGTLTAQGSRVPRRPDQDVMGAGCDRATVIATHSLVVGVLELVDLEAQLLENLAAHVALQLVLAGGCGWRDGVRGTDVCACMVACACGMQHVCNGGARLQLFSCWRLKLQGASKEGGRQGWGGVGG